MTESHRIIVLDDGKTWAVAGTWMTITDSAYRALLNGTATPLDLTEEDVLVEGDV